MGRFHRQKAIISAVGVFFVAFIAAFFASSIFTPSDMTNADTIIFGVEGTDYSTTVSSADNVEINVNATPGGTVAIGSDAITTITNNPEGYQLYFSMDQMADYDATHPGNALYQDGNSTSSHFISPTTGTISAPDILSVNTWGFALIGGENRQEGVPEEFAAFDPVYVDSNGKSSTGETGKKLNAAGKFAEVPLYPNAVLVQESDTATSEEGNELTVYYGVNGSMSLPDGHYIGQVNYFVLPESSARLADMISIDPTTLDSAGGQDVLIATSLHTNYEFSNDEIKVTFVNKEDESVTGTCRVTSTSVESGSLIFHCDSPSVKVGTYTVKVEIPLYGKVYEKDVEVMEIKKDFWTITTMQEMTSEICDSVYTPSNVTGDSAILADTKEKYLATEDGTAYVPQRILYDVRDNNSYIIRKLADGNCWMTENLVLDLWDNNGRAVTVLASKNDRSTFTYNIGTTSRGNNVQYHYIFNIATAGLGGSLSGDVNGSLCPVGWKLPYDYSVKVRKSYRNLFEKYGSSYSKVIASPTNFSLSGYAESGGVQYAGTYGDYWSSTATSSGSAYAYEVNRNLTQYNIYKSYGFSVRCVNI